MSEKVYDEEIAPALLRISQRCLELGLSFVASVEYEPGEIGATKSGIPKSAAQDIAVRGAMCRGNVDAMLIGLVKKWGPGNSLYLRTGDLSDRF